MDQPSFLADSDKGRGPEPLITAEAEVRELARQVLGAPKARRKTRYEPPLLRAKREQAARLGLVAKWAPYDVAKGHIRIHDPGFGEWYDVPYKDAPSWAQREARKRAELYKSGDRHTYELNARQMEQTWQAEPDAGIVEDHPLPD
jgi:hypothetical protein